MLWTTEQADGYFNSSPLFWHHAGHQAKPGSEFEFVPADKLRVRKRQGARLRPLAPESLPGLEISRMELVPGGAWWAFCTQGDT